MIHKCMEYSRSQTLPDKCSTSENTCENNPPTPKQQLSDVFILIHAQDNTEKCPLMCKKSLLLDFLNGFLEEWLHSVGVCQVEQTPEGSGPVSKGQLGVTKGLRGKNTVPKSPPLPEQLEKSSQVYKTLWFSRFQIINTGKKNICDYYSRNICIIYKIFVLYRKYLGLL